MSLIFTKDSEYEDMVCVGLFQGDYKLVVLDSTYSRGLSLFTIGLPVVCPVKKGPGGQFF